MTAREDALYTAREFAARTIPVTLWNNDDILRSVDAASVQVARILRDLFRFIEGADFAEDERLALLYGDAANAPSMRNGAFATLLWIQDRINAAAPDLAGVVFRWVGHVGEALDDYELTLVGRNRASDLAFDLLLRSLPTPAENGDLGAYALQYADLAARLESAFGAGAGNGQSRAEVLRLLQAHYALRRRQMPPPASTEFEAHGEMHYLIQQYWNEDDANRKSRTLSQELTHLRDWWHHVVVPSSQRFIAAGADPVSILVPSGHHQAPRHTFGDVWVRTLLPEIMKIATCRDYDAHVELSRSADVLMLVNQDLAEATPSRSAYWLGLLMQQKMMRAMTVILGAGSPKIEVAGFKRTLNEVLGRYITSETYVEMRVLLGEYEDALLRAFAEASNYTYGNPRQAWHPHLLSKNAMAQINWTPADRVYVLQHSSDGDIVPS